MHLSSRLPVLIAAAVIAALAWAQENSGTVFRSDTRLVVLHASVSDRKGQLLTSLPQKAFKVYENNVEQPIKVFRREDVPVSLGLIVDNSGSMRDKRKRVESAALSAVKVSNPRDEITVINFNDEPFHDAEFTDDIKKLEEALTKIDSRGGTAMRDAIGATIDYIKDKGKHQKKVILVITDGNDTASTQMTLEKLVQKAHDSEVVLYFIGLLSEEEKREAKKAKRAIDALAHASGGTAVYPESAADVGKVALAMAHEIRNQYIIGYTPTEQALDGSFRTIKVVADGPNRPTVRTRSGYYATPEAGTRSRSTETAANPPK